MPEHIKYEDDDLFNAETHHESSDVPISGLLWFIVAFVVALVVGYFVILGFYNALVKVEQKRMDPPQTAVARPANADVPQNQPLLEPFPRADGKGTVLPQTNTPVTNLQSLREREKQVLTTYGWVDKQHGVVRLPIDNAKALLAARLAATAPTPVAATTTAAPVVPGANAAPAGTVPPADTGVAQPATNGTTTGGAHQ